MYVCMCLCVCLCVCVCVCVCVCLCVCAFVYLHKDENVSTGLYLFCCIFEAAHVHLFVRVRMSLCGSVVFCLCVMFSASAFS